MQESSSQLLHSIPPLIVIGGLIAVCVIGFAVAVISTWRHFQKPARTVVQRAGRRSTTASGAPPRRTR